MQIDYSYTILVHHRPTARTNYVTHQNINDTSDCIIILTVRYQPVALNAVWCESESAKIDLVAL